MTTFFLPSLSEIVINALLIEYERGPVFCLTDSPDVVNALQLLGIGSFLVEYKSRKPEETDRLFAQIWQNIGIIGANQSPVQEANDSRKIASEID